MREPVERQPGRPSEEKFVRAAKCFIAAETNPRFHVMPHVALMEMLSLAIDRRIVKKEQAAEGAIPGETLLQYAKRRVADYENRQNP